MRPQELALTWSRAFFRASVSYVSGQDVLYRLTVLMVAQRFQTIELRTVVELHVE